MDEQTSRALEQGYQARREGRPADAKSSFELATARARQAGAASDLAMGLTGLGQVERDLDRPDAALGHYEEALALYRTLGDAQRIAHTIRHVGDLHRGAGRLDRAEPCYAEALTIYRTDLETGRLDLANTLRGFALLQEAAGHPDQACSLWREAGELYQLVGVDAGVAEAAGKVNLLGNK